MKVSLSSLCIDLGLWATLASCATLMACANHSKEAATAVRLATQALPAAPFGAEEMAHLSPSIAQDARGNRIAVWEEFDGQRFQIWAKRSVAGLGWGASTRLDAKHGGQAYSPRIAFDGQGHAMAVWQQQVGGHSKVWANQYVAGQGWGVARPIDSLASMTPSDAYAPQVAMNAVGEAVAVWQQSDGRHAHVRTSRFIPGAGWAGATSIGSATAYASAPEIVFDAQGTALVVWQQFDGQQTQRWASQQPENGGWSLPSMVEPRFEAPDMASAPLAYSTQRRVAVTEPKWTANALK
jgi:hypothetical protein